MILSRRKLRKDLSQFLQSPPNLVLAQILPITLFRPYIHLLGFLYYLARKEERKETSQSITSRISNGASRSEKLALLYRTYRGIFEHYLEKIIIATRSPSEMADYLLRYCEMGNTKWLDLLHIAGKGGIVATGHFGASEFLPVLLALNGYRTATLIRYKTVALREFAKKRAEAYNIVLIDANETHSSFQKALKAIREGRILVALCDEFNHWSPSKGSTIRVLGEECPADRGLAILQRRTKAPICLALLYRSYQSNGKRYRLALHPITEKGDTRPVSAAAWEILEKYIRRYPEQWYKWNAVAKGLANYRLRAL